MNRYTMSIDLRKRAFRKCLNVNERASHLGLTPILLLLIALGFSIISLQPAAAQTGADLAITKVADRTRVSLTDHVTYTITVTNLGPGTATNVIFTDAVPDQLNLFAFACHGATQISASSCQVDSLASGESASATLEAEIISNLAKSERRFTNTSYIAEESVANDPNSANNHAIEEIHVVGRLG
jgi:uncharacterized repeat protein (TIGR01451 family)